ncbi:MAG TPA: hypothetical protein VGG12_06950 [Methylovirgula sp.]
MPTPSYAAPATPFRAEGSNAEIVDLRAAIAETCRTMDAQLDAIELPSARSGISAEIRLELFARILHRNVAFQLEVDPSSASEVALCLLDQAQVILTPLLMNAEAVAIDNLANFIALQRAG